MTVGGGDASVEALSPTRAVITILKAMIGAGVLALPYGCSLVHLGLALPGMAIVAILNAMGIWRLVECSIHLSASSDEGGKLANDWGLGPAAAVSSTVFGRAGLVVACTSVLSAQIGCCICYVDVLTRTVAPYLEGILAPMMQKVVLFVLFCMLSLLRELRDLAWLSAVALAVYAYVVFALVKWGVSELSDGPEGTFWPVRWQGFGTWFGQAIFAFEGINVAQYVYRDMQAADPGPFLRVLTVSYVICWVLYSFVGGFGYWVYGANVKQVIYLSFPEGSLDVVTVEAVLCIVLLLTFAIQMYPVFHFVEATCLGPMSTNDDGPEKQQAASCKFWASAAVLRWITVLLVFLGALLVPDVAKIMDLCGALSFGTIGFVLPALLHLKVASSQLSALDVAVDLVLLISGLIAIILALLPNSS
mmetsp:Transcript_127134/g.230965  ORF Transcript_127134/g.230965 Transcript_127134/m.230965 type:complete len:418 (+) Transcript_127134:58-1311(+)